MKRVLVSLYVFQLAAIFVFSQHDTLSRNKNFESYKDNLGIYIYGISKINNFDISAKDYSTSLNYSPNENFNIGLGFSYKWLGTSLAFNFGFINNDEALHGNTTSFDSQIDIFLKKFYINTNLQAYKGFYWNNPDEFIKNWNIDDSTVIRPDIQTFTFGTTGIYVFNHNNFSFKAAYENSERQLNSSGSWLAGLKISLYDITADSSLIPKSVQKHYASAVNIGEISTINFGASGGYTYSFILKDYYYINMAIMLGMQLQTITLYDFQESESLTDSKVSTNVMFRMGIGCNKPNYYYGIALSADSFIIRNPNDTEFSYSYGKFRIFYGRRFKI
jgi:hypothetical protein